MHLTWKKLTGIELPLGTGGRREGELEEQGSVSQSRGNFSGPENCFVFAAFTFKIKVSIISKMIK